MNRSLPFFASLLIGCLFGTGCSTLIQQPTATFKSADVRNPAVDGVTVDFHVDVANPNPVSVPLSGAQYKLALGGTQVVDNKLETKSDLPAKGTLPLTIPVTLSFENILAAEKAISGSGGDVPYSFAGTLDFTPSGAAGLIGPIHVPLKFDGTLPLGKVVKDPSLLLKSPAAKKLAEKLFGS